MPKTKIPKKNKTRSNATAETMATEQRDISVSEFFAKNRHLLGFDNPRKAMLTAIKEAVDNALDACEEGGILPHIYVRVLQINESRFKLTIRDNGPGIVRSQIENIFGKLLYGSKFHRLKMSRGQQGIGISAAGMYGLMTTGKPLIIISKTGKKKPAHEVILKMDTSKNRPTVISDLEHPEDDGLFEEGHGTQVTIELEGKYQKGRQSIDEYLEQTAIANPHAHVTYVTPTNETLEYPRAIDELPEEPKEIKPHPKGIELGTLIQMIERTDQRQLGGFLTKDFCRVGATKAREICKVAGMTGQTWLKSVGHTEAEKLYDSIQKTRIIAPNTDCLVPIGSKALLAGLLKEVKAEFFAASTRPPNVYRGNPFQIEVAIGYGGGLGKDDSAKVLRFANRVPLLYSQSSCSSFKAVAETSWKNYGLTQPKNSIPSGPLVVMVHMVSVWVPFTSESKEAIADYDEIRKEMKLALQECGRKLGTYLRRRKRMERESERRSVFERYIGEISRCCHSLVGADTDKLYKALMKQAKRRTDEADAQLDDEGNILDDGGRLGNDDDVIIVDRMQDIPEQEETLFGKTTKKKKRKTTKKKTSRKRGAK
ncbi:MAG TPA: DNA topoisomerase VI subunit B [Phycisphaerales bacterium]|nr:DNA topoisomerase VI subunit B [Phycisphaerales bacterium]HIB50114.1 DNA topoisomerase VI subunit B [Phycisphaerales bacterium]HIN84198.1 DNA topoisomerase VI subunit B [Phycisphaerales bacterium]HIO52427.1 DNA topoisomerase VI subunit B [Phycisphaerales bacterium]